MRSLDSNKYFVEGDRNSTSDRYNFVRMVSNQGVFQGVKFAMSNYSGWFYTGTTYYFDGLNETFTNSRIFPLKFGNSLVY
jgi:hypothetical protein